MRDPRLLPQKTMSCEPNAPPRTRSPRLLDAPPQIHNEFGEPYDIVQDETDDDADEALGPQGAAAKTKDKMDQKAFERMLLKAETAGIDQLRVRLIAPPQPKPPPPPTGWCAGCLRPER
jgi:hypothetical protein